MKGGDPCGSCDQTPASQGSNLGIITWKNRTGSTQTATISLSNGQTIYADIIHDPLF